MSKCDLFIEMQPRDKPFTTNDTVSGVVRVVVNADCKCNGLHLYREWRTHGRGNRANGGLKGLTLFSGTWTPGEYSYPFEFRAPNGPCTYRGSLLHVDWYLKAAADIPWAFDPKAEGEFLLAPGDRGPFDLGPDVNRAGGGGWTEGCAVFFSVFGAVAVAGFFGLVALGVVVAGKPLVGLVIGVIGLALGATVGYFGVRRSLSATRLGAPKVTIEHREIAPGDTMKIHVETTTRGEVTLEGAEAYLEAEEVVVSGHGTDAVTHRNKVFTKSRALLEAPVTLRKGTYVAWDGAFEMPANGPLTFGAPSNHLNWRLRIVIRVAGWPDWDYTYSIVVRPASRAAGLR